MLHHVNAGPLALLVLLTWLSVAAEWLEEFAEGSSMRHVGDAGTVVDLAEAVAEVAELAVRKGSGW